MITSHNTNCV